MNHSFKKPNLVTKVWTKKLLSKLLKSLQRVGQLVEIFYVQVVELGQNPRLVLIAKKDISAGDELVYDYGDR